MKSRRGTGGFPPSSALTTTTTPSSPSAALCVAVIAANRCRVIAADPVLPSSSSSWISAELDELLSWMSCWIKLDEIFSKSLKQTDISARLAIPTDALKHINMPEGDNNVYPKDLDGKEWRFQCYTRPTGHPKPAFTTGWLDFVRAKGLQIGDKVTFSKLEDEAGGPPQYRIHASRLGAIKLMGAKVEGWADLP
ncbi:hypothetical protein EZV62_006185 [Acer yangbiense]|uniref:TF-B3 domain-containing protein n=1 Tax=Acer yangbiense TaxID=1000413 RepID=A0A5C7IPQ0_9ROSI|nr:hypothetical protein EZV62_006185 [Acer yangbiense]